MLMRLMQRSLNAMTAVAAIYCLLVIGLLYWPVAIMVLIVCGVKLARRPRGRLTTLGSARWADQSDIRRAGMLAARSGLVLGRLEGTETRSNRWCRDTDEWVRLPQACHCSIFAPTGAGKGVSLAIPFLLTSDESAVVTDFKGELYLKTAEDRRRRFGHRVVVLDPYKTVTQTPDVFNPLEAIDAASRHAIDDVNDLAAALVVRPPDEREPHWSDMAEAVIAAVCGVVVAYGEPGTRSLQTVRDILASPRLLEMATRLMTESPHWEGMLRPMGGHLMNLAEKERASVLSSALRHLKFLGTPAVAESTGGRGPISSTFDPRELRTSPMTVYLILPPDRATAQAGLLRMWVGSLMRACVRGGLQ